MTTAVATAEQKPKTTVAKTPPTIIDIVSSDGFKTQMAMVLPKHITADRMARIAVTLMRKVPKLRECTQESLLGALMTLSQLGLEPDGRRAHLIPYGKECTLVIDYKGYAELAKRSGFVKSIYAREVCANDEFRFENGVVTHRIDFQKPRGRIYAFCSQVTHIDGSMQGDVMTLTEVEGIRARSKAKDRGPWEGYPVILKGLEFEKLTVPAQDAIEMAKKSVFKRLSKLLVLSPEFRDAVEADDDAIETTAVTVSRQTLADLVATSDMEALPEPDAKVLESAEPEKPEPKVNSEPAAEDAKPYWFGLVSGCKDIPSLNRKHDQFDSVKKDLPEADAQAIEEAFAKRVTEL